MTEPRKLQKKRRKTAIFLVFDGSPQADQAKLAAMLKMHSKRLDLP
jgi:hypothetical protein